MSVVIGNAPYGITLGGETSGPGHSMMPAVVVGIDTPIGLAIIRDLGARGVKVIGIARAPNAIGLSSRFLSQGLLRADGAEGLIHQLVDLVQTLGDACLFAISESDIELLNRHRTRLAGYRFMFADSARMERVLNKEQTCAAAASVGIRVPRTEQIEELSDAAILSAALHYPVILKWSNPNEVVKTLSSAGLPLDKAHYCHSDAELIAYLAQYEKVGIYPLIQEYCSGFGLAQMILMHEGRAVYTFQHQRLHEWPPEGGFSTLCMSIGPAQHSMLMARSIALLQTLDWDGVAMVEYRHDPASGESAFMEINGRFWGSLPLACHAGATFPWFAYQLAALHKADIQNAYINGVRCRFMIPETKRLLRILFQQGAIVDRRLKFSRRREMASYLLEFLRPSRCYYVFQWHDPKPLLSDMLQNLQRLVPASLANRLRRNS